MPSPRGDVCGHLFLARRQRSPDQTSRNNGNQVLALVGYNAGEMSVVEYNGGPPYAETQSYVTLVQSLTERYRNQR
mgnify:CR=1 FL=1